MDYFSKKITDNEKNSQKYNWQYMATKIKTDYALISEININGKKILNIGAFEPIDELYFAKDVGEWVVTSLNPEEVNYAKQRLRTEFSTEIFKKFRFKACDATKVLDFPDEYFDVVLCFSTIDHIKGNENRQKAIREMIRVCKKEGHIIITVPNKLQLLYSLSPKKEFYEHKFTPWELKKMLKKENLQVISFKSTVNAESISYGNSRIGNAIYRLFKCLFFIPSFFGVRFGYLTKKTDMSP